MSHLAKSCSSCRARHSKCDGKDPCAQCKLRKSECLYPQAANRKKFHVWAEEQGPNTKISKLSEITSPDRLHHFKNLNNTQDGRDSVDSTMTNRLAGFSDNAEPRNSLRQLPMHQLISMVKEQSKELSALQMAVFDFSRKHLQHVEDNTNDIDPATHGMLSERFEWCHQLLESYKQRNAFFYPNGNVPINYDVARTVITRLQTKKALQNLLSSATIPELVETYSYSIVFAYSCKLLQKWELAEEFMVRTEKLLSSMLEKDLIKDSDSVSKVLSLIGFHTVILLGCGYDDRVRKIITIEHYLFVAHKHSLSVTLNAVMSGNIAAMTRDVAQRFYWTQKVDSFAALSIPPYYDSWRLIHIAGEVLLHPDGMYSLTALTSPLTEDEIKLKQLLLAQIQTAFIKMTSFPQYAYSSVESVDRSVTASLLASKAITCYFLGDIGGASTNAEAAITTIQKQDLPFFTTVLALSFVSCMQVFIVTQKRNLWDKAHELLDLLAPEIPRINVMKRKLNEQLTSFDQKAYFDQTNRSETDGTTRNPTVLNPIPTSYSLSSPASMHSLGSLNTPTTSTNTDHSTSSPKVNSNAPIPPFQQHPHFQLLEQNFQQQAELNLPMARQPQASTHKDASGALHFSPLYQTSGMQMYQPSFYPPAFNPMHPPWPSGFNQED